MNTNQGDFTDEQLQEFMETFSMTEEQLEEFKESFSIFDKDGDWIVTKSELGCVMRCLGIDQSDAELNEMINEVDGDGSAIDFRKYLQMMANRMKPQDNDNNELRDLFNKICLTYSGRDCNTINSGMLLKHFDSLASTSYKNRVSDDDLDQIFADSRLLGKNFLCYEEFALMMQKYFGYEIIDINYDDDFWKKKKEYDQRVEAAKKEYAEKFNRPKRSPAEAEAAFHRMKYPHLYRDPASPYYEGPTMGEKRKQEDPM